MEQPNPPYTHHRAIVDLLPRFLRTRFSGWRGRETALAQAGLAGPEFVLLRAMVEETDPGAAMSPAELGTNLFNPYSTIHSFLSSLPALVGQGFLVEEGERYMVTPRGRAAIAGLEGEVHAYLNTLAARAPAGTTRLAAMLVEIAERLWMAPEPRVKAHQARARRRCAIHSQHVLVQLDDAVYALWMARDDAHIAAWSAEGFDGPRVELLSQLWTGSADTVEALRSRVEQGQRTEDVTHGLDWLVGRGYVDRTGDRIELTSESRRVRDAIEAETDRLYFTPWPPLHSSEIAGLTTTLRMVCERLATM